MVDAARQMLDELMGRNRNLHPSEAVRKVNWDDPDFCQYYMVSFCPHDLFVNTRADLGPCLRIHDDEARDMYEQARPGARKRQYEDEFLRFCNSMLNDVDRKIIKGKQRLQLMHRDQPMSNPFITKYQEQLNNINARIKKLLSEAEEAGIRGDVDQAQDLMGLCEQLKEEKEALVAQHESTAKEVAAQESLDEKPPTQVQPDESAVETDKEDKDKKVPSWMQDLGTLPEKQMEVCETCGAFLIVGDAQQRIEDHLMGKQHLGYSKLRKAVEELHEKRQKERDEEDRVRREERSKRAPTTSREERIRDRGEYNDRRGHSRDRGNSRHQSDRHRHHKSSHHRRRSHSRSSRHRSSHASRSRSRSRF